MQESNFAQENLLKYQSGWKENEYTLGNFIQKLLNNLCSYKDRRFHEICFKKIHLQNVQEILGIYQLPQLLKEHNGLEKNLIFIILKDKAKQTDSKSCNYSSFTFLRNFPFKKDNFIVYHTLQKVLLLLTITCQKCYKEDTLSQPMDRKKRVKNDPRLHFRLIARLGESLTPSISPYIDSEIDVRKSFTQ